MTVAHPHQPRFTVHLLPGAMGLPSAHLYEGGKVRCYRSSLTPRGALGCVRLFVATLPDKTERRAAYRALRRASHSLPTTQTFYQETTRP